MFLICFLFVAAVVLTIVVQHVATHDRIVERGGRVRYQRKESKK